jgi:hypothetical protein
MQTRAAGMGLSLASVLLLSSCAPSYDGPIRDKPIQTIAQDQTKISLQTLGAKLGQADIPKTALEDALTYFDEHRDIIANQDWISILDFTPHSGQPRLYILDLNSGAVDHLLVAHGEGSDPQNTGYARKFSDVPNSWTSSLGFYLIAEPYFGKWGMAARLDGLDSTNQHARERDVVLHGADYVRPDLAQMGRT